MHLRRSSAVSACLCVLAALAIGPGCDDDTTPFPPTPALITSPQALIDVFARTIDASECGRAAALLADEPGANAVFRFELCTPTELGETSWGYDEEAVILCRLLEPGSPLPGAAPVPPELWLQSITLTLTRQDSFAERPDLYTADGGADGKLDPQRWRAEGARYTTYFFFDLAGTDYKVEGEADFVVIEDLTKNGSEAGRFLLYLWKEPCNAGPFVAGQASELGRIKSMYRARHRPETVIDALASAYARHDPDLFASILADTPNYSFSLASPSDRGETQWGADEDKRIHRRMFDRLAPGEPAVASELRVHGIQIHLGMREGFQERSDLYSAAPGDGKLDPLRWRALGATYGTYVFLDLEGSDYKVEGSARFVVIEDRTKQRGAEGKFLLYTWDDRQLVDPGLSIGGVNEATWTNVKRLYR